MDIRSLRYFLAVAREESMTEAANVLHVTQPTLSRQIAELEDELGKKLFERTNRNTTLTEEGMRLRQRAEEIVALTDQTEEEMKSDMHALTGCIRIGAGETHAMHFVTDAFLKLRQNHPGVTIELFTGNADAVRERLEHGLLDFGLLLEPVTLEHYDYIHLPEKDTVGIVTRRNGPWGKLEYVTPDDLKEMPVLISSRTQTKMVDLSKWSTGKITTKKLHVVGRFDLIGNAALLIKSGDVNAFSISGLLQRRIRILNSFR